MKELTKADFDTDVGRAARPVIVEFWGPNCGPCKMLDAPYRKAAEAHADAMDFYKIDISAEPDLATRCNVRATPTFVAFREGRETDRKVGGIPSSTLRDWIAAQG